MQKSVITYPTTQGRGVGVKRAPDLGRVVAVRHVRVYPPTKVGGSWPWSLRSHKLRLRCGGFTLIELVTSITVGVIISGIAGSLIWNASRQRAEVSARSELTDMGAAALEVMFRYIREIPQDAGMTGQAQIDTATATELRFGNIGLLLNTGTDTVEITNDNGTTWYPVVTDVGSVSFSYFDQTGGELTSFPLSQNDRWSVRRIRIDLQLTRSSQDAHVRTSIYLRRFMNEG